MPWFKVDDGLHAHKKAVRAGVPAMGLWVLAGTWCADQLTDGWVPDYIAARLDPNYEEHAASLVRAGLWLALEQDGEQGWLFHQWDEHQPSAKSVIEKRDEAKERMRRVREARRNSSQDVRANTSRTNDEVRLTPTRPDPTRTKELPTEVLDAAAPQRPRRGTRLPDDFAVTPEMVEWARANAANVDGRRETERFIDYWSAQSGAKGVKTDWIATWRNWMRTAQDNLAGRARPSLPPSSAPTAIPADQRCPDHRGERKGECRHCRAIAIGRPQETS